MPIELIKAKAGIDRIIFEAETCAKSELGFAAISTILSVVVAMGESLLGKPNGDQKQIGAFLKEMSDTSWLIAKDPSKIYNQQESSQIIYEIRSALLHQLSLPVTVGLINYTSEKAQFFNNTNNLSAISVNEFVAEVKKTVEKIIKKHPTSQLDSSPHYLKKVGVRNSVKRITYPVDPKIPNGVITSGSTAQ